MRELQSFKYWGLALVGVAIGVVTNLLTDLLKSVYARYFSAVSVRRLVNQMGSISYTDLFGAIALVCASFAWMKLDYYWTPRIVACGCAVIRALTLAKHLYANLPTDFPNRDREIAREVLLQFVTVWLVLFGLPRMCYWLTEWQWLTTIQVLSLVTIAILTFQMSARSESNKSQPADRSE
jgi:hypothetical protein